MLVSRLGSWVVMVLVIIGVVRMYVESLIYLAFQSWLFSVLIQFAEAEMDCI